MTRVPMGLDFGRWFAAPREAVFRAFADAEALRRWWGPPEFPVVDCTVDFRTGGIWHYRLRSADGAEIWARAVYREIVEPTRISYLENSSDAAGRVTEDRPAAFVTVTLEPRDGGTMLTSRVRYAGPLDRDRAMRSGIERGFSQALDALERLLPELVEL